MLLRLDLILHCTLPCKCTPEQSQPLATFNTHICFYDQANETAKLLHGVLRPCSVRSPLEVWNAAVNQAIWWHELGALLAVHFILLPLSACCSLSQERHNTHFNCYTIIGSKWRSLGVYCLSETVVNSAENATELHVEKQLSLFPCSLQTGAGLLAVGRSRVLSMVASAMWAWSQASLEVLHGQVSPQAELCCPPLWAEVD